MNHGKELWMKADIRRKRKVGKCDRVCRENKKDLEKSKNSNEESIGEDKVTSR